MSPMVSRGMELRDLIDHVGEERFAAAREWAWGTAATTGQGGQVEPASTGVRPLYKPQDVPHDLEDLVWTAGEASWVDRVALAFELYRQMPCYATLMYTTGYYPQWDRQARQLFWNEYRTLISDPDDRLAEPVAYSLWCDYFENPETVHKAWSEIARPDVLTERGLERVLDVSGPVPFRLKRALYDELVADERWHPFIFRSLLHSAFDVFGDVEIEAGRRLLAQLSVPEDAPGLRELRDKLASRSR